MLKSLELMVINASRRFVHTTSSNCKGHAKWQNIKHVKAANDRQKAVMTAKQMRNIRVAATGMLVHRIDWEMVN